MASSLVSLSASIGTQLMAEPGIHEELSRPQLVTFRDQHAARKYAERTFKHAHVLIKHERAKARAFQKRYNRRDQDRIVCPDKFAHGPMPDAGGWNFGRRPLLYV
jgi:hypothetical protein